MKKLLLILALGVASSLSAQNKYGLSPQKISDYRASVARKPNTELVEIQKAIPSIVLDIRYATTNNFTGAKIYQQAKAFARRPVIEALKKAQQDFAALGYGIKIYDAYRPYAATVKFFEIMHGDTTYVASPYKGSKHNRGCALDMTLVNLKTGEELKMPTPYDAAVKESWPTAPVADPVVRKNREVLISIMEKNGFRVYEAEWWHFDFNDWKNYDVMDISFEELTSNE